ncbi:hypothetical protein NUW54_g12868 [Trametes sanguinea]|uniref:Uncharacterized protein n=1 Tax=Trametes sanguinea TaxID=158606 RepID=A0ACC1MS46_9APHY|nr:hypothetical protein NUW54_g12868 [Trametes sanguinea]
MNAPWLAFAFFVPTFSHQSSFALSRTRTHKRARASLVLRQSESISLRIRQASPQQPYQRRTAKPTVHTRSSPPGTNCTHVELMIRPRAERQSPA